MSGTFADRRADGTPDRAPFAVRAFGGVWGFFEGWAFPAFMLTALAVFTAMMLTVLLVPPDLGPASRFAAEFKTWCFGWDPATGELEIIYVVMLLVNPLMLAAVTLGVWWKPLSEVWRGSRRVLLKPVGAAAGLAFLAAAGVVLLDESPAADAYAFPADGLRTELPVPDFALTDHTGAPVATVDLHGRVTVITAVYASCGLTCPMIMEQNKAVVADLTEAERRDLTVLAITLDPERDSVERLAALAEGQDIAAPLFRLATGEPAEVNRVLDDFNVERAWNEETGVIDHVNVFIVVDRSGRIAYRFGLGERQQQWLTEALRLLLAEEIPQE